MNIAYLFACDLHITTMRTIEQARVYEPVTRAAFAKMISNYAKNVLGKTPNTSKQCHFVDLDETNAELADFAIRSCQYDIMGINMLDNKFLPNRTITRGEIATVLSRLHGWAFDGVPYYSTHMAAMLSK